MDFNNFSKWEITIAEIDIFILWLLKANHSFLTLTRKEQEACLQDSLALVLSIFKWFQLNFDTKDVISKLDDYLLLLQTEDTIEELDRESLYQYKKIISQIRNKAQKIKFKKEILDAKIDRIELTKDKFIAYLTKAFSDIPLFINQELFCKKNTTENILEVPLSDINLEWFYYQDNINRGISLVQNIIEQVIQLQVNREYKYKKVNLFFLGNVINRELTKEQDFQESQINYNLMFEFSIYLIKAYFLLKEYFLEVHYTFSLEQSNYRQLELEKEHFSNYNMNFERLIPKLLISKLAKYNLEETIHDFGENSFYNITEYNPNSERITLSYWNYKGSWKDYIKTLFLDDIEKELLKSKKIYFRNSRIYIWAKDLYLNTDGHRELRICPSIYKLSDTKQILPIFELEKNGIEISKLWLRVSDKNKINLDPIDIKEDIQFYDFIKKTILSTKRDNRQLTIIQ